jgi:hypothetical protein
MVLPYSRVTVSVFGGLLFGAGAARGQAPTPKPSAPLLNGVILSAGYQAGLWNGGMGNLSAYALDLNRGAASVQEAMQWHNGFHGVHLRLTHIDDNVFFGLGWSNRHTIVDSRYTLADGKSYRTQYRVRLNELSLEGGYVLWNGRLRPGLGTDFGLFSVHSRTGEGSEAGSWHTFHDGSKSSFLSGGQRDPTVGLTLFCDVAPLGKRGGGLTLRPYYQHQVLSSDLFGRYGTFNSNSYQYEASNYGLVVSWGFSKFN